MTEPLVVGWKERVDFPEWGLRSVKAKIDTGARTSALNVCEYELIDGAVRFRPVVFRKRSPVCGKVVEVPITRMVVVRNSGGVDELRPEVETLIQVGSFVKRVRLTLTNRSRMKFALILGRTTLAQSFVVDVTQQYVQRRPR